MRKVSSDHQTSPVFPSHSQVPRCAIRWLSARLASLLRTASSASLRSVTSRMTPCQYRGLPSLFRTTTASSRTHTTDPSLAIRRYSSLNGSSPPASKRSEEHTSELQSRQYLVCRLLLEKKKKPKRLLYTYCDTSDELTP